MLNPLNNFYIKHSFKYMCKGKNRVYLIKKVYFKKEDIIIRPPEKNRNTVGFTTVSQLRFKAFIRQIG